MTNLGREIRASQKPPAQEAPFTVAALSPVRVYLWGGSDLIDVVNATNQTLTIGSKGVAMFDPPKKPVLLRATYLAP